MISDMQELGVTVGVNDVQAAFVNVSLCDGARLAICCLEAGFSVGSSITLH